MIAMADVYEIAKQRSTKLATELAEVDEFIRKAKSWWKMVESTQKKCTALQALPH